MVFSAAAWSFDWLPPYEDALCSIAALGIPGVELRIHSRDELENYYTEETVAALRARLDEKHLTLTALNITPIGASSAQEEERRQAVKDFRRAAGIACALGTGLITVGASYPFEMKATDEHYKPSMQVWNMDVPGNRDFTQNYEDYLDTLRRFAAICRESGLRMAVETVPNSWVRNTDAALRLMDKLQDEGIGITYDVANISMVGDLPEIFIYRLNRHIYNVQLADNHGLNNAHWRPGKGKNDFNAIVRALDDVGYRGSLCLELADATGAGRSPEALYDPHGDHAKLSKEYRLAMAEIERVCREEGV